jgi:DNA-binding IclR family transcriptional regulator
MGAALNAPADQPLDRGAEPPPRYDKIRSLIKGLKLLELLNQHPALCFREVCQKTGLSEGTAFRMLRTLVEMGLVKLDSTTRTYSVAQRVMTLSHGYDSEGWVSAVAWPRLRRLGHEIDWPVSLSMLSGAYVLVRATTDQFSHMVLGVSRAGRQLPIMGSCSGMTLLAHLPRAEQTARLALLKGTTQRAIVASRTREAWCELLEQIRCNGWWGHVQSETRQSFVSFPVKMDEDNVLGVVTMKYFTSTMTLENAADRYGRAVRAATEDINTGYQAWCCDMDVGSRHG